MATTDSKRLPARAYAVAVAVLLAGADIAGQRESRSPNDVLWQFETGG